MKNGHAEIDPAFADFTPLFTHPRLRGFSHG
jgi:hypothetical protein